MRPNQPSRPSPGRIDEISHAVLACRFEGVPIVGSVRTGSARSVESGSAPIARRYGFEATSWFSRPFMSGRWSLCFFCPPIKARNPPFFRDGQDVRPTGKGTAPERSRSSRERSHLGGARGSRLRKRHADDGGGVVTPLRRGRRQVSSRPSQNPQARFGTGLPLNAFYRFEFIS